MAWKLLDIGQLFYLFIILLALLGSYFIYSKNNVYRQLQSRAIWGLIFFGLIGIYGLWEDIQKHLTNKNDPLKILANDEIIIEKKADGHFYLPITVNTISVRFLIDTGATRSILSQMDFYNLGLSKVKSSPDITLTTANGKIMASISEPVNLSIRDIDLGTHQFLIVKENVRGPESSLMGMDIIKKFSQFKISGAKLTLKY